MSSIRHRHGLTRMPLWTQYTQQLTGTRVCIDATFKVAKRIRNSNVRLLWSMMDIGSQCILSQQFLTHESHEDVLPMLERYAQRCIELSVPLPVRVCSDRGLMDANVINHPSAFPLAHINVDPWHFQQLFTNTLNKGSSVWSDVSVQFKKAMYTEVSDSDGRTVLTHAEPGAIVDAVDGLIKRYSHAGSDAVAAVTKKSIGWWEAQKGKILQSRMCSHPPAGDRHVFKMASSPLENYHRQLNRVLRNLVRCSEDTMHVFLMQFMFHWNVDRRRALPGSAAERDWHTYDFVLVDEAYQACVKATGKNAAEKLWGGSFALPQRLQTYEEFGLFHNHVTLNHRMTAVQGHMPFSATLIESIVSKHTSPPPPDTVVQTVTTGAASSSSTSRNSVPASPVAPLGRMTPAERALLATLRHDDVVMQQAIRNKQWSDAAVRWNSFREQHGARLGNTQLNIVHGDHIKLAVAALDGAANRQLEHAFIQQEELRAQRAFDEVVPYVGVSPLVQHFTPLEDAHLRLMVEAFTSVKGVISWQKVTKRWMLTYKAQVEANAVLRLVPRSDESLRSRWSVLKTRAAKKRPARKDVTTESVMPADSEADGDAAAEVDDNGKKEPASDAVQPTSSSAAPPAQRSVLTSMLEWLNVSAPPPLPPPPALVSSSSAYAALPPAVVTEQKDWHWGEKATRLFNQLGRQCEYNWTYDEFCAVWPVEEYGHVSESRWRNKQRIERQHLRTGSRVKRKGAGERNCPPNCDEEHEHQRGSPAKRHKGLVVIR
jgi:hypothetical protein